MRQPTVFIVDDEERVCLSLGVILKNAGYRYAYATSGESALKAIAGHKFDLILSDVHMPGIDGFELLERTLSLMPGTPFVLMTGDATVDAAVTALRMGAYDYLKKPFEPEELLKTIENGWKQKYLLERTHLLHRRLKLSERRFRFILKNTPDMIYTLDPAGHFKYVNDSAAQTYGYRSNDLVGQHYESILWDEDLPYARWRFNERRTGSRATCGLTLRLKPGPRQTTTTATSSYFSVIELYASGVYRNGKASGPKPLIGTYGIIRDMSQHTDRRRDSSKTLFAAKSHDRKLREIGYDLNGFLSSTIGMTSALKQKFPSDSPDLEQIENIESHLSKGHAQARHLLALVNGKPLDDRSAKPRASTRRVIFRLKAPKAKQVLLAGDFNGWDAPTNPLEKNSDGLWETHLLLPAGSYEFKFMVDGKWRDAQAHERTAPNSYGTLNNLVVVGES